MTRAWSLPKNKAEPHSSPSTRTRSRTCFGTVDILGSVRRCAPRRQRRITTPANAARQTNKAATPPSISGVILDCAFLVGLTVKAVVLATWSTTSRKSSLHSISKKLVTSFEDVALICREKMSLPGSMLAIEINENDLLSSSFPRSAEGI